MIRRVLGFSPVVAAGLVSVAAAEGDVAYGEYLASECTTCHLLGATEATGGVPLITGWDAETFVLILKDFKTGVRDNAAMELVTARLGEEEMAALAAYFAQAE
ncbi:hypothetical protein JANAI62_34560 [Jannaschia pagri]|uniref:Cytochrome c domain-containing protein n=1 Tax=Jannaschia pagri TaxID=2829797 RepID=A0ABQ4NQZ5_9RHOB|nr:MULTISPECIES: hypothetical protein [unclassified Jannaschia]GIT92998.1 hypothetical protein JANAI61_34560 [Jannaschia sp. AI_61]GIT96833.1 hypothetical protein JANAI62_34560 [Jannaschia sp. AI_62]